MTVAELIAEVCNFFLAGSGLGSLICAARRRHHFWPPEDRWPELGSDGRIRQCARCLYIECASDPTINSRS